MFAAAIAAVKQESDQQPLRVTTTNAFASRWLVPRLPAWRKLHPDVPLEVIGTDTVLDLRAGDGDVAIRYATSRVLPTEGIVNDLFSDTFWPVCHPRLISTGCLKRPVELANHGRQPIVSRPHGRDGLPRLSAGGAKCPNSRTCST